MKVTTFASIDSDDRIHDSVKDAFDGYKSYAHRISATDLDTLERNFTPDELMVIDIAFLELPEPATDLTAICTRARRLMPRAKILFLITTITPALISQTFVAEAAGCLDRRGDLTFLPIYADLIRHNVPVYPAILADILRRFPCWFEGLVYPPRNYDLSRRELEVLRLVATGEANKVIARNLDITEATVKVHLRAILTKMDVDNRTQAALRAIQNGVIDKSELTSDRTMNKPTRRCSDNNKG